MRTAHIQYVRVTSIATVRSCNVHRASRPDTSNVIPSRVKYDAVNGLINRTQFSIHWFIRKEAPNYCLHAYIERNGGRNHILKRLAF
jgi:hypothetical protein